MATSKPAAPRSNSPVKTRKWHLPNWMSFPQTLRDAIPRWPETARSLKLAAITGDCSHTVEFGRAVKLDFRLEETGKLNGVFTVTAGLDIDAARALAATLNKLLERAERMPATRVFGTVV
jgi:hypothetical protein